MAVPAIFKVPAETLLGPKMQALTEKQRLFVVAMAELGTFDYTRCARAAGYSAESENGLRVTAHRLAHDEKIQAAMHEEAQRRMNVGGFIGVSVAAEIATDPIHKDRLKAAGMLMDRSGLHAKSEHTVKVQDQSRTEEALLERAKQLAGELGFNQADVLKAIGVIDAESREVEEWEGG
jgi:phage terminase small subunit